MEKKDFEAFIEGVIGPVVDEPEVRALDGSGKVFSFFAKDHEDVRWFLDGRPEKVAFGRGDPDTFDVRASMTSDDWVELLSGRLSATQAMLRRKIAAEGSLLALMNLPIDGLLRCHERYMGSARSAEAPRE